MSSPRVRPEFVRPLAAEPQAFYSALAAALADTTSSCRGHTFEDGAMLRIDRDERHIWSPALALRIDGSEDGARLLRGRFSPSSPVWTAFVAIYLGLLCVGIAAGCYGWAQWTLGREPWALLGVPAAVALAGFTYGAAFIGQGLGAGDMYELRSFVERVADGVDGGGDAASPPLHEPDDRKRTG